MANCHNLFIEFNKIISLPDDKKSELREERNTLRDKIEVKFEEKNAECELKFSGQGSYAMHTIIHPESGEYDIDDGIYIISSNDAGCVGTPTTIHQWVKEAIEDSVEEVIDKTTCVRAIVNDECHIDFPIYHKKTYENEFTPDDIPLLAHKANGWIESDPLAFKQWFNKKAKDHNQLRRLVKYMKAWADNKAADMPKGIVMTILAANNYVSNDCDDKAMLYTLKGIKSNLDTCFKCFRPTPKTDEDLLEEYSKTKKDYFLNALSSFINSAEQAIAHSSQKEACKKWQKHLGCRFPCELAEDEEQGKQYSAPAILNAPSARSA